MARSINKAKCSACGAEKPHDGKHFVVNKSCKNGVTRVCKDCRNDYHRRWKSDNKVRIALRRRELYRLNEKVVEAKRVRERWRNDPYKLRAQLIRRYIVARARERNVPFDDKQLTVKFLRDWLARQLTCECCRVKFNLARLRGNGPHHDTPTVDRVVPSLGYVVGNIALLCFRCNSIKHDSTPGELEMVLAWLRSKVVIKPAAISVR